MKGTLIQNGRATGASQQEIEQAVAAGMFFWLDLDIHDPGPDDDVTGMLANTFRFHPLAVEAADIATVFLPLGFLTGFFGQNFAWPITHIQDGFGDFIFLGLGSEVVAILLLLMLFKRRGWLGSGPTA